MAELGGQPVPYRVECGGAAAFAVRGEVAGGCQVDVVVEQVDDRHGPGGARARRERPVAVEGGPRVEDRAVDRLPVQSGASAGGVPGGVGQQQFRCGGGAGGGLAQDPQVQGEVVRGRGPGRQGDDGPQGAAPQQVGADAAAGAAGGGGRRHHQDGGAAGPEPGQGVLHPGELGLGACGEAVLPARVVGEFVVAPVAFVERRVAEHRVGGELREGVGAQGVAGLGVHVGGAVEGEPQGGGGREVRLGLLGVEGGRAGGGAQQGAGAGGRVEDRARGAVSGGGEGGHEGGGPGRGEGVLPGVGVEVAAEKELEGGAAAVLGGQFGGAAQQRHGRQERARVRGGDGAGGAEPFGEHVVQCGWESLRELGVRHRGEVAPAARPFPYEEEGAARVHEGGHGTRGVGGDVLPDAFPQRHLGELPLGAQPGFDVGEGEGGAGLGAADGPGEVGVPPPPVADGRAADAGEPGDPGGGHLGAGRRGRRCGDVCRCGDGRRRGGGRR